MDQAGGRALGAEPAQHHVRILGMSPGRGLGEQFRRHLRRVVSRNSHPRLKDAPIQEKLRALDEQLKLRLPSGQEQQIMPQLPLALRKRNDYDPDLFKKTFAALAGDLPPK